MLLIIGELFSRMNGFLWGVSDFLYLTSCVSFNSSSNTFMHGVRLEIAVEGCQEIPDRNEKGIQIFLIKRLRNGL